MTSAWVVHMPCAGLQQRGGQTPVIEAMAASIPVVRDHEKLIKALEPLKNGAAPAVGVVDAVGRLVGYVTIENIGELMLLRSAVRCTCAGHAVSGARVLLSSRVTDPQAGRYPGGYPFWPAGARRRATVGVA
ncbi:hypothetical protein [Mesorhizobium sp.]|nr:hypothetical protein [Mesorhizobium sp.]RWM02517.1 MAG: hypothetical protein EOR71_27915 [Mesorhizobium sp.]TIO56774.1 MAG: hypothetical protein E5X79_28960 [Mesorhizobium sp.]